jgi:alkanesulfonate monooxygenase SsuD/methylene tetrahydromethanopterin reductase-like flavin-dependent oxidoreductase (luciferase family)
MFFAAASQRTTTIRFGTAVTVLPLAHPIATAERIAVLDHLTGGRVEFGTGRGGHRRDYDAMEVPYAENRERWEESLALILKAWTETDFTFSGRFFHVTEQSSIEVVKPILKKDVPNNMKYLEQMFGMNLDKLTYEDLVSANRVICGSPAECIEQLKPYAELGVDLMLLKLDRMTDRETLQGPFFAV